MRRKDKPIDQRLYLNMPPFLKLVTAEATAADQKEFVQILSSNSKFIDLHHICGYDMVAEIQVARVSGCGCAYDCAKGFGYCRISG